MEIGSFTTLRKLDQTLVIGDQDSEFFAVVTVREVRGNRTLLNVTAPKDVKVLRGELLNLPEAQ